jgi:hypothetical protein
MADAGSSFQTIAKDILPPLCLSSKGIYYKFHFWCEAEALVSRSFWNVPKEVGM